MRRRGWGWVLVMMLLAAPPLALDPPAAATHGTAPTVAQLPSPRAGSAAVWDDVRGDVLVFGGSDSTWLGALDEIVRFHPATGEVTLLATRRPTPLTHAAAVWADGVAYIVGGRRSPHTLSDQVLRFDPATEDLTVLGARLPAPNEGLGAVWTGQQLLIFGAKTCSGCGYNSILVYDPATDTLTQRPERLPNVMQSFYGAVWDGTQAWLFGPAQTWGVAYPRSPVYTFDPATGEARQVAQLRNDLHGEAVVAAGGAAYLVGGRQSSLAPVGWSGGFVTDDVVRFDLETTEGTTLVGGLAAPLYDAAAATDGTTVWTLGGRRAAQAHPRVADITAFTLGQHDLGDRAVARVVALGQAECRQGVGHFVLDAHHSYGPTGSSLTYQWSSPHADVAIDFPAFVVTRASSPLGEREAQLTVRAGDTTDTLAVAMDVVDTMPPGNWLRFNGTQGPWRSGWYRSNVTVELFAEDTCGGPVETRWSLNGAPTSTSPSVTLTTEGVHRLDWTSIDVRGNVAPMRTNTVSIDRTPPTADLHLEGHGGERGWWRSPVMARLEASDALSGLWLTHLSVDGVFNPGSPIAVIRGEGRHPVDYGAEDYAGNKAGPHGVEMGIDQTPPTVALARPRPGRAYVSDQEVEASVFSEPLVVGDLTVRANASDVPSGVHRVEFLVDGLLREATHGPDFAFVWAAGQETSGAHVLTVRAFDLAENVAESSMTVQTVATAATPPTPFGGPPRLALSKVPSTA